VSYWHLAGSSFFFFLGWPGTTIFLISSASEVAKSTGMNLQHLDKKNEYFLSRKLALGNCQFGRLKRRELWGGPIGSRKPWSSP
jgi:hypothetical protein